MHSAHTETIQRPEAVERSGRTARHIATHTSEGPCQARSTGPDRARVLDEQPAWRQDRLDPVRTNGCEPATPCRQVGLVAIGQAVRDLRQGVDACGSVAVQVGRLGVLVRCPRFTKPCSDAVSDSVAETYTDTENAPSNLPSSTGSADPTDADLALIVQSWGILPQSTRRSILDLVKSARDFG